MPGKKKQNPGLSIRTKGAGRESSRKGDGQPAGEVPAAQSQRRVRASGGLRHGLATVREKAGRLAETHAMGTAAGALALGFVSAALWPATKAERQAFAAGIETARRIGRRLEKTEQFAPLAAVARSLMHRFSS